MTYVPTYSEIKEEIVSVTLNLNNYATQKEFENVTKVDTSDFALKTKVAEIKNKVDDDKIDFINKFKEKIMLKTVFCVISQNKDILKHQSFLKDMFSLGNW